MSRDRAENGDWGSFEQAEAWRKESFSARTPHQRIQWLKSALILAYQSGALELPRAMTQDEWEKMGEKNGS